MADNYSVPPPPPPARKPVPPPPPRIGGQPAGQAPVPPAPAPMPVSAPSTPMARPPSGSPATPPSMPLGPMPGLPGMGHGGPMEQRVQEMEKRFQEQENAKRSLVSQLDELSKQLKDEHEKVLMQNLKAKEEEALSSRVEGQLRDMQDKLRRDKHEQALVDSRTKAET